MKEAPSFEGASLVPATPPSRRHRGGELLTVGAQLGRCGLSCRIPLVVNKSTHLITSSATGATLSEVEE